MAMVQRDDYIGEIQKTDALLEYAVMHGDEAEAVRLREKLRRLSDLGDSSLRGRGGQCECKPVWNGAN